MAIAARDPLDALVRDLDALDTPRRQPAQDLDALVSDLDALDATRPVAAEPSRLRRPALPIMGQPLEEEPPAAPRAPLLPLFPSIQPVLTMPEEPEEPPGTPIPLPTAPVRSIMQGVSESAIGTGARLALKPTGIPTRIEPVVDPNMVDRTITGLSSLLTDLPILVAGGGAGGAAAKGMVTWGLGQLAKGALTQPGTYLRASQALIRGVRAFVGASQGAGALGLEGAIKGGVQEAMRQAEQPEGPAAVATTEPTRPLPPIPDTADPKYLRTLTREIIAKDYQGVPAHQLRGDQDAVDDIDMKLRQRFWGPSVKPGAAGAAEVSEAEGAKPGFDIRRIITAAVKEGTKGAALGGITFGLSSQVPPGVLKVLTEAAVFGAAGPPIHEGRAPTLQDLVESGVQIGVIAGAFRLAGIRPPRALSEIVEAGTPEAAAAARATRVGVGETEAARRARGRPSPPVAPPAPPEAPGALGGAVAPAAAPTPRPAAPAAPAARAAPAGPVVAPEITAPAPVARLSGLSDEQLVALYRPALEQQGPGPLTTEVADVRAELGRRGLDNEAAYRGEVQRDLEKVVEQLDALDRTPATTALDQAAIERAGKPIAPATPVATVPERPETLARQLEALERGDKPAVLLPPGTPAPALAEDLASLDTDKGVLVYRPEAVAEAARDLPGDTLPDKLRWAVDNDQEGLVLGYGVAAKPAPGEPITLVEARGPAGEEVQTVVAPSPTPAEVVESAERVAPPEGGEVRVTGPEGAEARAAEVVSARMGRQRALVPVTPEESQRLVANVDAFLAGDTLATLREEIAGFVGRGERLDVTTIDDNAPVRQEAERLRDLIDEHLDGQADPLIRQHLEDQRAELEGVVGALTPAGAQMERGRIEPSEEGGERGGRRGLREPRAPDRAPLAGAPAKDVEGPRAGGPAPPERPGGGAVDLGGAARAERGGEGPLQPGVGAGEGGVGAPAERGGPPEPGVRPERPPRARGEPVPERAAGRDFRITEPERIGQGSPREKARANLEALRLLKQVEEAGRPATPEEQAVLARYIGWGGMPQPFAPANIAREWQGVRAELEAALTPEEFTSARASTPNAHYTSPLVVEAMWRAAERLGLEPGSTVLEPALGAGYFFGLMPEALLPGSRRTGIELDSVTGRIAKLLYPQATIYVQGFEAVRLPDDYFDLAISNVPFGNYGVHDPRYRKTPSLLRSIHDYFFAKALDKVRPGGVVAFITTSYTMDKVDSGVRRHLASRADLLGAIRLPNTAFKGIAGTEVTTDVLFLQKRAPQAEAKGEAWENLTTIRGKGGDDIHVNEYFARHPEMMLGEMALTGTMYRDRMPTLEGALTREALDAAVARLPAGALTPAALPAAEGLPAVEVPGAGAVKEGGYAVRGDLLVVREGERFTPAQVSAGAVARIKGMLGVRDAVREVFRTQLEDRPEAEITAARAALNTAYDAFARRHGPLSGRENYAAFTGDPDHPLLLSLEHYDAQTKRATKADVFTKRTLERYRPVERAETAIEALTVSLNERGRIDWLRMEELTGKTPAELQAELADLVYRNPEGGAWEAADIYLSGNVRAKLAAAEAAAKSNPAFERNATALRLVQPKDLEAGEIDVRLGAPWVPAGDIQDFVTTLLDTYVGHFRVRYVEPIATWTVETRGVKDFAANTQTWGTGRYYADELIADALNLRLPTVYDVIRDAEGERRILNVPETTAAREQQQKIKEEFKKWIWRDAERATGLVRTYNEQMNNLRPWQPDGKHLTLPGSNPAITLAPHQKDAVWRALQSPTTLLAHVVGAGKTFEMAATAMELKRIGLAKKPMIVVPNHLVEQWGAEFLRLYPAANLLVAGKEHFAKGKRQRIMSRIATGAYDAVIVAHKSFEFLPVTDRTFSSYLQEQLDELATYLTELKAERADARVVKEIEKAKRRLEAKLKQRANREAKDVTLTFEELGVDALFVDEAHAFKNLYFNTKMTRVSGLPNTESNRAFDMFVKTQYVQQMGGRVVFATGTPVSNTLAEVFTMQRYLQMPLLRERGLAQFDAWAANFGETVTTLETAPTGAGYRVHTRFSQFTNVPELSAMFRLVSDVQTAEMLKLPVPKVAGGKARAIAAPASPQLTAFVETLLARAERIRKGGVPPHVDNMLAITTDGRKAALDMRLVDPEAPDIPKSKINLAVEEIFTRWHATRAKRLTQLVFIDFSRPGEPGERRFSAYDDVKAKLVRRGVPADEVRFIHDAESDLAKKQLFDAVNAGRVRILMGSTAKMGVGMNVQRLLVAKHDLDAPWRPADVEQRDGRILRQGNSNEEVEVLRYVTEGSFDAYMWQGLERKARMIAQLMRGEVTVRRIEDVDEVALTYAEMKAIASGNPAVMEKVKTDAEVGKLDNLRAHHEGTIVRLKMKLTHLPHDIEFNRASQREYEEDIAHLKRAKPEGTEFAVTVGGKVFTGKGAREEAGKALAAIIKERIGQVGAFKAGEYFGFDLTVVGFESKSILPSVYVERQGRYLATVNEQNPTGTIQSVESVVLNIEGKAAQAKGIVARLEKDLATLQEEIKKPFEHEARLTALLAKQAELNRQLNLDQHEPEAAAVDEAAEGETEAERTSVPEEEAEVEVDEPPEAPTSADEVSRENLREVREQKRREEAAGRTTAGILAGPLGLLFRGRRARAAAPPGGPPAPPPAAVAAPGGAPEPRGVRFRGHPSAPQGDIERALTSTAAGGLPGLGERLVGAYDATRRATTFEWDLRPYPLERDEVRTFQAAKRRARVLAGEDVTGVVGRLPDRAELEHFTRIVYLRDYRSRLLMPERFPGGVPENLTLERVEAELARLEDSAPERVSAALEADVRLMGAERDDLEERGLMDPDRAIPDYRPHFVLDFEGQGPELPSVRRIKRPFRRFLQRARGSARLIETDYIRAMFRHRAEVRMANAIDDFALEILARHDKADQLPKEVRRHLRPGQLLTVADVEHQVTQYRPGRSVFPVRTIAEEAVAQALANGETTLSIDLEDVGRAGALGRYYKLYVVPREIAERFEHFAPEAVSDGVRLLNEATGRWKAVTIGFWGQAGNVLNLMGDLMNLARTPGALLHLPRAALEVAKWQRGTGSDLARRMEDHDVLSSGFVANEAHFRAKAPELRQFLTRGQAMKERALDLVRFYFRAIPTYREAVPRAAMALFQLRRLRRGKPLRPGPLDVRGLEGTERGAMKIAREFTVDYGKFTDFENRVLRGFLLPFYSWCVPTDCEALTRHGWKSHKDLGLGDELLTYKVETGALEWQRLQEIALFEYDGVLMHLKNGRDHFAFTPDHRWPVVEGKSRRRKVVRGYQLRSTHCVPRTGDYQESASLLSPRHAAILGWVVTDGYCRWRGNSCEMVIYQSPKKFLREILDLVGDDGTAGTPHPETGVVPVRLKAPLIRELTVTYHDKGDLPRVVGGLSRHAAEAMWGAMFMAEGHDDRYHKHFAQQPGPVLDAFQMLCLMTGRSAKLGKRGCYVRRAQTMKVAGCLGTEWYSGRVWCPVTPNGTWVMRRNGAVLVTGNTRQNTPNWLRFLWMSRLGLAAFLGLRLIMELWNNDDDERQAVERGLPAYKRNAAHIVTGWRDEDGKMIVIHFVGDPMADALGMVGLAGTPSRLSDLASGHITLDEAARDQLLALVKEPGQRVTGLLTPLVKVPIELAVGKSTLTGAELVPRELQGTSEGPRRLGRYAAESFFRPLREERMLRVQAGKKEGLDVLTHRFGLGLPFERVEAGEAQERVLMNRWYEAMHQAAEQAITETRESVDFATNPPHVQELDLREAAEKARRQFMKANPVPVSRAERRRRLRER